MGGHCNDTCLDIHKDEELGLKFKLLRPNFHKINWWHYFGGTLISSMLCIVCTYLTATKTALQAILRLFFLPSMTILLDKLMILGRTHYAKQADPVYPFPGRDKRGKYAEKHNCWWISIFIPSSDISSAHSIFLFISQLHMFRKAQFLYTLTMFLPQSFWAPQAVLLAIWVFENLEVILHSSLYLTYNNKLPANLDGRASKIKSQSHFRPIFIAF